MSAFIDERRGDFGVEPICRNLNVSAFAYYQRKTGKRSARVVEDERLTARIHETHLANYEAYGYRRMHAQLVREGESVGRDQVARLMRCAGVQGASSMNRLTLWYKLSGHFNNSPSHRELEAWCTAPCGVVSGSTVIATSHQLDIFKTYKPGLRSTR